MRDRPAQREELFAQFRSSLLEFGCTTAEVRGIGATRERAALAAATALLAPAGRP